LAFIFVSVDRSNRSQALSAFDRREWVTERSPRGFTPTLKKAPNENQDWRFRNLVLSSLCEGDVCGSFIDWRGLLTSSVALTTTNPGGTREDGSRLRIALIPSETNATGAST
jgi:hypothetical protein